MHCAKPCVFPSTESQQAKDISQELVHLGGSVYTLVGEVLGSFSDATGCAVSIVVHQPSEQVICTQVGGL